MTEEEEVVVVVVAVVVVTEGRRWVEGSTRSGGEGGGKEEEEEGTALEGRFRWRPLDPRPQPWETSGRAVHAARHTYTYI